MSPKSGGDSAAHDPDTDSTVVADHASSTIEASGTTTTGSVSAPPTVSSAGLDAVLIAGPASARAELPQQPLERPATEAMVAECREHFITGAYCSGGPHATVGQGLTHLVLDA